jgi:hypothetical protein
VANRFGQTRTGRAVMRCPCGWVLNMGGPHGTPAVATEETLVKVVSRRERREPVLPMGEPMTQGLRVGRAETKNRCGRCSEIERREAIARERGDQQVVCSVRWDAYGRDTYGSQARERTSGRGWRSPCSRP